MPRISTTATAAPQSEKFLSQPDLDTEDDGGSFSGQELNPRTSIFWGTLLPEGGSKSASGGKGKFEDPPRNPFYHRIRAGCFRKIMIVFFTIFIVPIRVIFGLLCFTLSYIIACLALCCLSVHKLGTVRISGCRRCLRCISHFFLRGALFCVGLLWVSIKGKRSRPKDAPILVLAPHSTAFDAVVVLSAGGPTPSLVAKSGVHATPIVGKLVDTTQPVYVFRENSDSRRTAARAIKNRATGVKVKPSLGHKRSEVGNEKEDEETEIEYEEVWSQIMIFPEGTCGNRKYLVKFKLGAFLPGVPVQPVILRWPNRFDSLTWTFDGPGAFTTIYLTACQFFTSLHVEFLPVYNPSPEEQKDARLYARNVQVLMGAAAGLKTTDWGFEDTPMLMQIKRSSLQRHFKQVWKLRFVQLSKLMGSTAVEIEAYLKIQGASLTSKKSSPASKWLLTADDFASILKLTESEGIKSKSKKKINQLFTLFNNKAERKGQIDFREYFLHTVLLTHPKIPTDKLAIIIFALYGEGDGKEIKEQSLDRSVLITCFHSTFFVSEEMTAGLIYKGQRHSRSQSQPNPTSSGRSGGELDANASLSTSSMREGLLNKSDHGVDVEEIFTDLITLKEFQKNFRKMMDVIKFTAFEASGRLRVLR